MRVYALACLFSKIGGNYAAGGAKEQGRTGFDVIQAAYSGRLAVQVCCLSGLRIFTPRITNIVRSMLSY